MNETTQTLQNTGVILDIRPEVLKAQDFKHEDKLKLTASAEAPVEWIEKDKYKFYDKRNQQSSLSCMAQSGAKLLGIEQPVFQTLSAKKVYQSRTNNGGGMYQQDSLSFLCKPLSPSEKLLPSQNQNEQQINSPVELTQEMIDEAKETKASKYYILKRYNDIDTIASIIEKGKGVQLMLFFHGNEYWKPEPKVEDHTLLYWEDRAARHGVTAVDYTLVNGKKCLIIEDSAGNEYSLNKNGQRILTEEFVIERCYASGYIEKNALEIIMPTLRRGAKGDMVKKLQVRLGGIIADGIFGIKTEQAVKNYQGNKGLVPDGIVGIKTCIELNK